MRYLFIILLMLSLTVVVINCGGDEEATTEDETVQAAAEEVPQTVTDPSIMPEGPVRVYTIRTEDADVMGPDHIYLYENGYVIYMTGLSDEADDTHFVHAFGGNYKIEGASLTITLDRKASVLQQGFMNAANELEPIPGDKYVVYSFTFEQKENSIVLSNKQELHRALLPQLNIKEGEYVEGQMREETTIKDEVSELD